MQKILVPYDESKSARHALDFAVALAGKTGSTELHIINVYEPIVVGAREIAYHDAPTIASQQKARSEGTLEAAVAHISKTKPAELTTTTAALAGDTAKMIITYAAEHGCDHIVMGTHGRSTLGTIFLGSVAQRILHLSALPVTLVK